MASSNDTYGLILLGNSGVGKSFLANCFLNDDQAFESRFAARSVTHLTEWKSIQGLIDRRYYDVANIPGLIEGNQKLVDQNRDEIVKALDRYPLSIIIFVFGHRNGRISNEDLAAFHAITDAYEFHPASLLILINGIPLDRSDDYFDQTNDLLHQLTDVDYNRVYFIEKMTSREGKANLYRTLHELVAQCQPHRQKKKHDILLTTDELARLKTLYKEKQQQLANQEEEHSEEIKQPKTPDPKETFMVIQRQSSMVEQHIQSVRNQNQKLQQQLNNEQVKIMAENSNDPHEDFTVQLAQQLQRSNQQNQYLLGRLEAQPNVMIIEKKSSRIPKRIRNGIKVIRNILTSSERADHPAQ